MASVLPFFTNAFFSILPRVRAMQSFFFISLGLLLHVYLTYARESCVYFLQRMLDEQVQAYQATIHVVGKLPRSSLAMFRGLQDTPRVVIDLESSKVIPSAELSADPRYTILHVILHSSNSEESRFRRLVEFVSELSQAKRRPKLVLVLFKDYLMTPGVEKTMFEHAWSRKFLDFTIFKTDGCTLQHYNPFSKEILSIKVDDKSRIFPDKLNDVQGYTLKLAVGNFDSIQKVRDAEEKVSGVRALKYHLLSAALKIMNFSIEFVEIREKLPFFDVLQLVHKQLERNEANVLVRPLASIGHDKLLMIYLENDCDKLVAYIPYKSQSSAFSLSISPEILIFSGFLPFFCLISYGFIKQIRSKREKWQFFYVIEIFFGMSTRKPKGFADRFIYLYVIIVSALYSIDFYSSFLDIGLIGSENSIDTFRDLNRSSFKFYMQIDHFFKVPWEMDEYTSSIQSRTEVVKAIFPCLVNLAQKDDRICITLESLGDGISVPRSYPINKAKPVFNCLRLSYTFETSSPFAEKLNVIFRRIYESGIEPILDRKKVQSEESKAEKERGRNLLIIVLGFIMGVGNVLSFVAFLYETKLLRLKRSQDIIYF